MVRKSSSMESFIKEDTKTIALVSNNYWTLYKFRYDVINLFLNKGYKVILIAGKDSYERKFNQGNLVKYHIPIEARGVNPYTELKTFFKIYRIYKQTKVNLVLHFTIKPNIYGSLAARFLKIKSISFITGVGHIFINDNSFFTKFIKYLYKAALKDTLEVWFTNISDKKLFLKNKIINTKTIAKIVPGAGVVFKENVSKDKGNSKVNFIMVSRLLMIKGVLEYIMVAQKYNKDPGVIFTLIGAHNPKDIDSIDRKILDKAIKQGWIIYYDYQDNVTEHISKASCLIHPSYREGISTILIEAASLYTPIITTTAPGCIDVIPDNSFGLLCEPRNLLSLERKVQDFLLMTNEEKHHMVDKAYNYVKSNFERQIILRNYEGLDVYLN